MPQRGDRAVASGSCNVEPYDLLKRRVAPGSCQKALTPLQLRRILSRSCPWDWGYTHGPLCHFKRVLAASCTLPRAG